MKLRRYLLSVCLSLATVFASASAFASDVSEVALKSFVGSTPKVSQALLVDEQCEVHYQKMLIESKVQKFEAIRVTSFVIDTGAIEEQAMALERSFSLASLNTNTKLFTDSSVLSSETKNLDIYIADRQKDPRLRSIFSHNYNMNFSA